MIDDIQEITKKPLLVGQLEGLAAIISGYSTGVYTYNQAVNMIKIGIGLTEEEANQLLDKQD